MFQIFHDMGTNTLIIKHSTQENKLKKNKQSKCSVASHTNLSLSEKWKQILAIVSFKHSSSSQFLTTQTNPKSAKMLRVKLLNRNVEFKILRIISILL